MKNKIRIKLLLDNNYAIKFLYKQKIDIYNIEYLKSGNIYTIEESQLENIKPELVEVISYTGLKSLIFRLKRCRHFIGATLLSLFLLYLGNFIIIDVDVIHSDKKIRFLVEDELYDLGIKPFIIKKSFDSIQKIKEKVKNNYPNDIEWLEIIEDGMKYTVRVEERIITKENKPKDFCNIVSTKDATILSVVSSKGQSLVLQNDFVKKGDTLISGEIKFNEATKSHVCAEGIVYGNTWYRVSISVPLEHTTKEYTNKKKNNLAFEFGSTYNRVFRVHFDDYDVEKTRLFGVGRFAIYKEKIKEYTPIKNTYTEEEALKEALKLAKEKLMIKLDENAEILNEKVLQSSTYDSIISVDVFYAVKEIISKSVESEYIEKESDEELE